MCRRLLLELVLRLLLTSPVRILPHVCIEFCHRSAECHAFQHCPVWIMSDRCAENNIPSILDGRFGHL